MKKTSLSFRAAVLAFGNGFAALVQLLIAAVLARQLTQADYGVYRQAMLFFSMVLPILLLGLPSALLYFLPRETQHGRNRLTENLLLLAGAGMLMSAFLALGGAELVAWQFNEPALVEPLRWFAWLPLFAAPLAAVSPCLIAAKRPAWVAGFAIGRGILRLLLVVLPVLFLAATPVVAIQGTILTSVLVFLPGLYLMRRAIPAGTFRPSRNGIWEQLSYAVPLGIGGMIGTIHKATDKFVVASLVPSDAFATFECGAMEIPFISLITGSAASVMVPELARLYREGDYPAALGIFRRSAVKCSTLLVPIAGWFFVSAPWVMTTIYGGKFADSATVFRVYLLMLPLRVAFFGPLFQAAGRSDLVMTRSLIGFLGNVILTIVGAYYFGPLGAAAGTVLSILLFAYVYCLYASAQLYETRVRDLLPLSELAARMVPVVMIVAMLMWGTHWLGADQSLTLMAWIVLSLLYVSAVSAAYLWLRIVSISELLAIVNRLLARGK